MKVAAGGRVAKMTDRGPDATPRRLSGLDNARL